MLAPSVLTTRSYEAKADFEEALGRPLLLNDWMRTLFLHFEVDPAALAPYVPYELDLFEGKAYVSLVAFELERLRPSIAGGVLRPFCRPLSEHGFLNVRTYVKHRGETGIYFLREWLANRISVAIGPTLYGLPYRFGRLDYREARDAELDRRVLDGCVRDPREIGTLAWHAETPADEHFEPVRAGTLDEFLLERYVAFTKHGTRERLFRVWHEPWPQTRVDAELLDLSLLRTTGDWVDEARFIFANYSPGVEDVWVSAPRTISA